MAIEHGNLILGHALHKTGEGRIGWWLVVIIFKVVFFRHTIEYSYENQ
jgi:hypothetical protein